jgi:hypothetical protein
VQPLRTEKLYRNDPCIDCELHKSGGPFLDLYSLERLEILLDVGPFALMSCMDQALLQFLSQHDRQKAANT